MSEWHPFTWLAVGFVMIPLALRAVAALADWLETTRVGQWLKEADRGE